MIAKVPAPARVGARLCGWLGVSFACVAIPGCPARIDDTPDRAASPRPAPAEPTAAQSADSDAADEALPPELDPAPSRPVVAALQRVFGSRRATAEEVDAAFAPQLDWTAPLAATPRDDLDIHVALRGDTSAATRVLDLGRSVVLVQLEANDGGRSVLVMEVDGEHVTAVRRYGATVLGAAPPPSPQPVAIADGRPSVRNISITRKLYEAASVHEWQVFDGLVSARAAHTEASGASSMLAGLQALLGDEDTITIRRHYAAGRYVVVEALVTRPGGAVRRPVAAFVDVLRLDGGEVVASERYVNRGPAD